MMSVTAATGLLDAIAAAGGEPDAALRAARVQRSTLQRAEGVMASGAFSRLLEEAARSTGDDCFGLHFGERFDPRDVGLLAYVVLNSPTLAAAMYNVARYVHIHNSAVRATFGTDGRRAYVRYRLTESAQGGVRQHNEYSMVMLWKALRSITQETWAPAAVEFAHDAPGSCDYFRSFGCAVDFGCPANALVVEHDFVERRVREADGKLYRLLRRQLDRILAELPRVDDLLDAVRRAIGEALESADAKLERVAAKLSMSPRTLERRLKARGSSYRDVVADTRKACAIAYLRTGERSVTEIAFLLGYSEVSAFNRAFKRWTGSTPLEYRNARRGNEPPVERLMPPEQAR
jgi:AraC-like DNA-binding protein